MSATDRYKAKALTVGDSPEWVGGFVIKGYGAYIITDAHMYSAVISRSGHASVGAVEVNPSTLCQCTGLKDSQGKLIFEGDLLQLYSRTIKVYWSQDHWVFRETKESYEARGAGHTGPVWANIDTDLQHFTLTGKNIHDKQTEQ
jgi:hypothetical protein